MLYKLKPGVESFEIMSGPDEGKAFVRGRSYSTVPEGYADRFECVDPVGCPPKSQIQAAKKPEKKTPTETLEAVDPVNVPMFLQKNQQTDNKETD